MRPLFSCLTLLAFASISQAQIVEFPPINLAPVTMQDQFQKTHRVGAMKGHILVLIYGDRKSAERNKQIGQWLHVMFHPGARGLPPQQAQGAPVRPIPGWAPDAVHPDVRAIPVACIGKVPELVAKLIRRQVQKGSPSVPVWLDFDDTMKQRFGLKAKVPNLVVIDKAGRLRYGAKGMLNEGQLQQLSELIENLRREPINNNGAPR